MWHHPPPLCAFYISLTGECQVTEFFRCSSLMLHQVSLRFSSWLEVFGCSQNVSIIYRVIKLATIAVCTGCPTWALETPSVCWRLPSLLFFSHWLSFLRRPAADRITTVSYSFKFIMNYVSIKGGAVAWIRFCLLVKVVSFYDNYTFTICTHVLSYCQICSGHAD